jgi:hypothetical protein
MEAAKKLLGEFKEGFKKEVRCGEGMIVYNLFIQYILKSIHKEHEWSFNHTT